MGEHEEPPSHPDELLHQLCIQPSCRRTPPVLPFSQLQNFGEVFPGFCWDSVHNAKGGGICARVGKAGWDRGKGCAALPGCLDTRHCRHLVTWDSPVAPAELLVHSAPGDALPGKGAGDPPGTPTQRASCASDMSCKMQANPVGRNDGVRLQFRRLNVFLIITML